jgi:hypothetical protein
MPFTILVVQQTQGLGVMGADVLRMKICAKFERCASYQVQC